MATKINNSIFYFVCIMLMFSCQHNPANVPIVYKNSNGAGYQASKFEALEESPTQLEFAGVEERSKSTKIESPPTKSIKPSNQALELEPLKMEEAQTVKIPNTKETQIIKTEENQNVKITPTKELNEVKGKYHVTQKGETYYSISRLYFLEPKNLMKWNGVKANDKLYPGTIVRLFNEGEESVLHNVKTLEIQQSSNATTSVASTTSAKKLEIIKDPSATPTSNSKTIPESKPASQAKSSDKIKKCGEKFIMPVEGLKVETKFGDTYKGGVKSDGIIFGSKVAQNVKASNGGEVAYVGDGFSDYGNIVIIRHNNSYFSIYGYLSNTLVKRGQIVKKEEVIASTNTRDRKFYFSIRKGKTPINPLDCM